MASRDKLLQRFKTLPIDFKWAELRKLLMQLGYAEYEGRGSRKCFRGDGLPQIRLHKPHPNPNIPRYAVKQVYETLKEAGLI